MLMASILPLVSFAQAPRVSLVLEPVGTLQTDPMTDPTADLFMYDSARVTLIIDLGDTNNVATIHVRLGTSSGSGGLVSEDFTFDGVAALGNGHTYRRNGRAVYLGLGTYVGFSSLYGSVSLRDGSGNDGAWAEDAFAPH